MFCVVYHIAPFIEIKFRFEEENLVVFPILPSSVLLRRMKGGIVYAKINLYSLIDRIAAMKFFRQNIFPQQELLAPLFESNFN